MESKRLYRSSRDSIIAGVCGGLGDYFNVDPVLFRILFVLAAVFGGSGVIIYIVLWIVIPYQPGYSFTESNINQDTMNNENMKNDSRNPNETDQSNQKRNGGSLWGGLILITLGAVFLIDRFVPRIDFGDLWPVILIVIGIILISNAYRQPKS